VLKNSTRKGNIKNMSNETVILAFLEKKAAHTPTRNILNGIYMYKGQTLKSNGLELINYSTRIAYHENNKLYLNIKKYSSTTSHIQSKIRRLATEKNYQIVEYKEA
jgi:hypothetical protein